MGKNLLFICGMSLVSLACSVETMSEADLAGEAEEAGQISQPLWSAWNDNGWSSFNVGMAIAGSNTFQWFNDGWVCRGPFSHPCGGTMYTYSAPNNAFTQIAGVGIAKNTSNVYAWYNDSTVSQGRSDNFTFFNGKIAFTRPAKPSGGLFAMSQLIEVDNSDNGLWYYYWKEPNGVVYRTVGSSTNASSSSGWQQVTASNPNQIVGIAFGASSPASVYTFYSNGNLNRSTTSLNLEQP